MFEYKERSRPYYGKPTEPAQALEKVWCYGMIGVAVCLFVGAAVTEGPGLLTVVVPIGMVVIAVARLKGWIRRWGR